MCIDIHQFLFGKQGDNIPKIAPQSFTVTFIETRNKNYLMAQAIIGEKSDSQRNYGYTNFRFGERVDNINYIEFELGGYRLDKIYPQTIPNPSTFPKVENLILPAIRYHEYMIHANYSGDLEIVFDVFQIDHSPSYILFLSSYNDLFESERMKIANTPIGQNETLDISKLNLEKNGQ